MDTSWGALPVVLMLIGEMTVAALLAAVVPRRFRLAALALIGLLVLGGLCAKAYSDGLARNGGDSMGGWSDAALVVVANTPLFIILWSIGAALGFKLRDRFSASSGDPSNA